MPTISGTSINDFLSGSQQGDLIRGYAGNDTLEGGEGNDNLQGGEDDDELYGGLSPYTMDAETIRLVSVSSEGNPANNTSELPSISADGRYIAFASSSSYLVPGDTNNLKDVFVHDIQTGVTRRVSVASDGSQGIGYGDSTQPSISADGRYVAFVSGASNLVEGDTNGDDDVFVHDLLTGETRRVSITSDGSQSNDFSNFPSISADGRFVAFGSMANLVEEDISYGLWDIYVHDLHSGETRRISVASDGSQGNSGSGLPAITPDGRYVAFSSDAFNLVPGDTNGNNDIFVHDLHTGENLRVSVASDGAQGNASSHVSSISADGRYVTFISDASNLVTGDTNAATDIFIHDLVTRETRRISVASDGSQANNHSSWQQISADGRYVAFVSIASNLVAGDTNNVPDTFVHDLQTGETRLISNAPDGSNFHQGSSLWRLSISADGSYVAFVMGHQDVYVVDTGFGSGSVEWASKSFRDGDDTLRGGSGNDLLDGGGGNNWAMYDDATGGVTVDLSLIGPQVTGGSGTDTLLNIDNLHGSDHDDHLSGNDGINTLFGEGGNDLLEGGAGDDLLFDDAGNDTLLGGDGDDYLAGGPGDNYIDGGAGTNTVDYSRSDAGITVDLSSFSVHSTGTDGYDIIINAQIVIGSHFADVLVGDAEANYLVGQEGDDVLTGADGNDTLAGLGGADTLNGGAGDDLLAGDAGSDWADYRDAASGVTVNLSLTSAQATGSAGTDTLQNIENIFGSAFDDQLSGNTGNNTLDGGAGNDLLVGGSGNDKLVGGAGNDSLHGGAGNDSFYGGAGDDFMEGGSGNNLVYYSDSTAGVTIDLSNTSAQNTAAAGFDTILDIQGVAGSVFADLLVGSEETNSLSGDAGDDTLLAGAGNDMLSGGAGNDLLDGGDGSDVANFLEALSGVTVNLSLSGPQNTGVAGIDTLLGIENLYGSQHDDHLSGDSGDNNIQGFNGNDTLLGANGNDSLDGGTGDDLLDGGDGIDTAAYSFTNGNLMVDLSLSGPQATGVGGTDTLLQIENLFGGFWSDHLSGNNGDNELRGGAGGNDSLYGAAGNDTLRGESSPDLLVGGDGNDVLDGGQGNDTIDGGAGTDTSIYLNDAEQYLLLWSADSWTVIATQGQEGIDELSGIELIQFSDKAVNIASTPHASYASIPDELWQFFIVAFGGAPGVFYMDQLLRNYNNGKTVQGFLDIFITKAQFLELYPPTLGREEFATLFVNNVVQDSTVEQYKDLAVQDIINQFASGKTLGQVIYTSIGKMARLGEGNQIWGNTARLFNNQIKVAKFYTDTMSQSTTDTATLRALIANVDYDMNLDNEAVLIELIGSTLLGLEVV